jgi:predicted amidohydrolase
MSRVLTAVAAQVDPVPGDQGASFEKFEREVNRLARSLPQAQLYVPPELYLSAVGSWDTMLPTGHLRTAAQPIPGL